MRRCRCAARPARPRARARHAVAAASGRRPPSSGSLLRLLCRSVLPKSAAVRRRGAVSSLPGRLRAAVGSGGGRGGRCGARGAAGEAGHRRSPPARRAPIPGVERGRARRCGARVESRTRACGMAWVPARTERRIRGGLAEAGRSSGRLEACSGAESSFWREGWAEPAPPLRASSKQPPWYRHSSRCAPPDCARPTPKPAPRPDHCALPLTRFGCALLVARGGGPLTLPLPLTLP